MGAMTYAAGPLPYERTGRGPALLLLHGALVDRAFWRPLYGRLADHYELIACDLPGHGAGAALPGPTSVGAFAEAVLATLDELKLEQAIVLGHSLGGMVAQELALQAPERVAALALVDTWCHPRGFLWEPFPYRTVYLHWMLRTVPVAQMVELMAMGLAQRNSQITPYARQVMGRYVGERDSYLHIWDAATDFNTYDRLDQIACPTLVAVSDEYFFTQYQARVMAQRIPAAQLAVIPRSGHWVSWDNPEGFVEALLRFLG